MLPMSYLYPSALAVLLMGLVMTVRRVQLGFALVSAACLGVVAYQIFLAGYHFGTVGSIYLGLLVVMACLGLFIELISEKLHLRLGWIGQNTVWAGLIGGMVGLFLLKGAFWMLVGTLVGTVAVQFSGRAGKMDVGRALRDGLEGFFAMFGSAGLRVLLAVVMIDLFLDLIR